ncbi:MAG: hypothetical protein ACI9TY_001652 [Alphaproteobacteria bacterium]|jgi:hypothetical protein
MEKFQPIALQGAKICGLFLAFFAVYCGVATLLVSI